MVTYKTAKKLLHATAVHMGSNDDDAFAIVCASCRDGVIRDPEEMLLTFKEGYNAPTWFVDTCIDIITGRIPLVDYPVFQKEDAPLFD